MRGGALSALQHGILVCRHQIRKKIGEAGQVAQVRFYMPRLITENITSELEQMQDGCLEHRRAIQSGLEYMQTSPQNCLILVH